MKTSFLSLILAALCVSTFAQEVNPDRMVRNITGGANPQPNYQIQSISANAIVDKWNNMRLNAWSGTIYIYPDATHQLTFPLATGVLATTGTTSSYGFEGATADAYETYIKVVDPTTADTNVWIPNLAGVGNADDNMTFVVSTIDSGLNAPGLANSIWMGSNSIVGEGATADAYEGTATFPDVTADRTWANSDASGTYVLAQASTTTALTADDQAVTPGVNRILQLTSDNATATNRTFTLSATGAIAGMTYILIGPATNQCEIADTGIQKLSATWTPGAYDTLTLLFDGTNFIETGRSDN